MKMDIRISRYEDSLRDSTIDLHAREYQNDGREFALFFDSWFSSVLIKRAPIMVVALIDDKVIGFQSWVYWPYERNGVVYNSYQSGHTLVDTEYRRRGLFYKMLEFGEEIAKKSGIDFFIGFPIPSSYPGLLKVSWNNPVNLNWYMKILHPIDILRKNTNKKFVKLDTSPALRKSDRINVNGFRLASDENFLRWRQNAKRDGFQYIYHNYQKDDISVCFEMKHRTSHGFSELVIGDIITNTNKNCYVIGAIHDLFKRLKDMPDIAGISIAINPYGFEFFISFLISGFVPIIKKIYFMNKSICIKDSKLLKKTRSWDIFCSDINYW